MKTEWHCPGCGCSSETLGPCSEHETICGNCWTQGRKVRLKRWQAGEEPAKQPR